MKGISVSAPGKLMLFGEHAVVYGHPCIVAAVDSRVYATIEKATVKKKKPANPEVSSYYTSGVYQVDTSGISGGDDRFVRAAVAVFEGHLGKKITGIKITTHSELDKISGLGSSAAVTVATVSALALFFESKLSKRKLFELSYKAVLEVQTVGSGFDVAASVYGGVVYFADKGEIIELLNVKKMPLIVGYTGVKADSAALIKKVAKERKENPKKTEQIFADMSEIAEQAKKALLVSDWKRLGQLMQQNQKLLERLGVNSKELDWLTTAALDAGAYGAKLSGAGGGDCMIAIVAENKRKTVERAISEGKGEGIPAQIGKNGVRNEKY